MSTGRRVGSWFLYALPLLAIALAGARPLHDLPGRDVLGALLLGVSLVSAWLVGRRPSADRADAVGTLQLAGVLLLAPWMLIAALWIGLGAPFQADAAENQHRYALLCVAALVVSAGFTVLHDALRDRGERAFSAAAFAAAVPAGALYVVCVAITLAHATMAERGDHTPAPALVGHLYDALEFFACSLTYLATALYALAMHRAGLLGRGAARAFAAVNVVILVLLALRGIEYPEISGETAPWYTQPGVIVRIPAIAWLMPGLLGARLLRFAGGR